MDYGRLIATAERYGAENEKNALLAPYTTFRIGGPCDLLVKPASAECLTELVKVCREDDLPFRILGKGSNILVADEGLRCVVIVPSFAECQVRDDRLVCGAGASLVSVCRVALDNSLTGLEFAFGIPGTVGGALYMNAGAYGGEMKDVAVSCTYIDKEGNLCQMAAEDMNLSYRHSIFEDNGGIITSVTIQLKKGSREEISAKMNELMNRRRDKQPLDLPSAGSTFKRPEGDFAARLIEASGLKGFSVGGAAVSEKHSGFVVNKDKATFADVMKLIECVKEKVYADSGIMLECEVKIWQ